MPIQFTCPHCGVQTSVAEQYAGQSGPCAHCGGSVTVPPLAGTPGYSPSKKGSQTAIVITVVLVVALGALLVCGVGFLFFVRLSSSVPPPLPAPSTVSSSECRNNLKWIGLAMQLYYEEHGTFPPAYVADEDGKPMHSWRALLLPYLEEESLCDAYDFDKPWDDPANLALAERMPDVYRCPADPEDDGSTTSYVIIVGPETISDGPTAHGLEDVKDGAETTILVVEAAGSGINWLKPEDLNAEQISFRINDGTPKGIRTDHPDGVNALFCDGSLRRLNTWTDPQQIKDMTTIAGGEPISALPEY